MMPGCSLTLTPRPPSPAGRPPWGLGVALILRLMARV